jgi:pyruvate formate lyase activating enzyme
MTLKEARLYEKSENNQVSCFLCNHYCHISDGKLGICGVRENRAGTLYTHTYGKPISQAIDPIEKKPLYHFFPGSRSFSIATVGCNFQCGFCQNWQISQVKEAKKIQLRTRDVEPEEIVKQAKRSGSLSISYTYTEPTIFFEYAYDIAQLAKKERLYTVFVTNGFMTEETILTIQPYLDAANVDLKSFSEDYYKKICKGKLGPVLKSIELMKKLNIWVEVTTLLVTGLNDSEDEMMKIAGFIAGVDKTIPWHISRFYPQYQMGDLDATPPDVLNRASLGNKRAYVAHLKWGWETVLHAITKGPDREIWFLGKSLPSQGWEMSPLWKPDRRGWPLRRRDKRRSILEAQ